MNATLSAPRHEILRERIRKALTSHELANLIQSICLVTDYGSPEREEICTIAAAKQIAIFEEDLMRRN